MKQPRAGSDGTVQISLRLPVDLRDRIRHASEHEGSSINSLIVRILEEHLPKSRELDAALLDLEIACQKLPLAETEFDRKFWRDERDDALSRVHQFLSQSESP